MKSMIAEAPVLFNLSVEPQFKPIQRVASLRTGTNYAGDPRAIAITEAARRLVQLRDHWLNPPEWVAWIDEPGPNFPQRPIPRDESASVQLKRRTLTNLYNARPQWLADAHAALDAAVSAAYGWPGDISVDDALRELLALNMNRRE